MRKYKITICPPDLSPAHPDLSRLENHQITLQVAFGELIEQSPELTIQFRGGDLVGKVTDKDARVTAERKIQEISEAQIRGQEHGPLALGKPKNLPVAFAPQAMVADVPNFKSAILQDPAA